MPLLYLVCFTALVAFLAGIMIRYRNHYAPDSAMSDKKRIYCVAGQVSLRDMGLFLKAGESATVPETIANRSQDLERYRAMGLVQVGSLSHTPLSVRSMLPARTAPSTTKPEVRSQMLESILELLQKHDRILLDLIALCETHLTHLSMCQDSVLKWRKEIDRRFGETAETLTSHHQMLKDILEHLRKNPVAVVAGNAPQATKARIDMDDDRPVFIPSNIVDREGGERVGTTEESGGESDHLSEAAALLKSIKRKGS